MMIRCFLMYFCDWTGGRKATCLPGEAESEELDGDSGAEHLVREVASDGEGGFATAGPKGESGALEGEVRAECLEKGVELVYIEEVV